MADTCSIDASLDPVLGCLARSERRFVVEYLYRTGGSTHLEDLEAALLDHESRRELQARQVVSDLHHRHLPLLEENGIVDVTGQTVALRDDTAVGVIELLRERSERAAAGSRSGHGNGASPGTVTRRTCEPGREHALTESILDAIEEHRGAELSRADFDLYEDLDHRALDELFRADADPETRVAVTTLRVHVELWVDDGVQIRVTDAVTR